MHIHSHYADSDVPLKGFDLYCTYRDVQYYAT